MTYTVRGDTLLHKAPSFPEINLLFFDYMFLATNQKLKSVCVLKGLLDLMTDPFTSIPHNWMSSPEEEVPTVNQLNSNDRNRSFNMAKRLLNCQFIMVFSLTICLSKVHVNIIAPYSSKSKRSLSRSITTEIMNTIVSPIQAVHTKTYYLFFNSNIITNT